MTAPSPYGPPPQGPQQGIRHPLPAPRSQGKGCLKAFVICAALGLVVAVVGPALFYFEWFKPREYLRSWSAVSYGVPPGTMSLVIDHGNSRTYELGYVGTCRKGCHEDLEGETYTWMNKNGLPISRLEVTQCYHGGCVRYASHEGHRIKIWFDPVGNDTYQFTLTLYY